ncbi:MAG: AraC family transcriptional regulator [Alphaproteobacteria bacterium]
MDVLNDILDTIELRATLYFRTRFTAPYAIAVPPYRQAIRFHLVVQGRCHVASDGAAGADLGMGELVLVPRGAAHVIADRAGREPVALDRVVAESGFDGAGPLVWGAAQAGANEETHLICGHFTYDEGVDHPLLRALPTLLRVSAPARARHPLLDGVLGLVAKAGSQDEPGARGSLIRLSEVLFIESVRAAAQDHEDLDRVLGAMADPRIGRALALIHGAPERDWTLASLASAVAMSRSRFAAYFSTIVGVAPMRYLADWRLQRPCAGRAHPRPDPGGRRQDRLRLGRRLHPRLRRPLWPVAAGAAPGVGRRNLTDRPDGLTERPVFPAPD